MGPESTPTRGLRVSLGEGIAAAWRVLPWVHPVNASPQGEEGRPHQHGVTEALEK